MGPQFGSKIIYVAPIWLPIWIQNYICGPNLAPIWIQNIIWGAPRAPGPGPGPGPCQQTHVPCQQTHVPCQPTHIPCQAIYLVNQPIYLVNQPIPSHGNKYGVPTPGASGGFFPGKTTIPGKQVSVLGKKCVLIAYIIKSDDFPAHVRCRRKRYMARGSDPTFPAPVVRMTVVLPNSLEL